MKRTLAMGLMLARTILARDWEVLPTNVEGQPQGMAFILSETENTKMPVSVLLTSKGDPMVTLMVTARVQFEKGHAILEITPGMLKDIQDGKWQMVASTVDQEMRKSK